MRGLQVFGKNEEHTEDPNISKASMHIANKLSARFARMVLPAAAMFCIAAPAQTSPAAAAAAAGSTSTSANGGTGGVGLGGTGPGVAASANSNTGVGVSGAGRASGNGALVGPRAKKEAQELIADKPGLQDVAPANSGQRALMLDREQRNPALPKK